MDDKLEVGAICEEKDSFIWTVDFTEHDVLDKHAIHNNIYGPRPDMRMHAGDICFVSWSR